MQVKVEDKNTAIVFVPADQLSLAIGKDGRNVRLAANLTGWKIDIKTAEVTPEETEAQENSEESEEKPKKKTKKKSSTAKATTDEEVGTDGEAEESTPEEVNDATEEKPEPIE